ncbi:hypothetical protein Tco_0980370, partial [Tanacetum coccineum]
VALAESNSSDIPPVAYTVNLERSLAIASMTLCYSPKLT